MIEHDRPPVWVKIERKPSALLRRTVGIALTPSERARVQRMAVSQGMTMSSWSRSVLVKELARIEAEIEAGKAERRKARESTANKSA